ncbi:MAG: hypothetical protein WBG19_02360 [Thermoplasmata archaeon]
MQAEVVRRDDHLPESRPASPPQLLPPTPAPGEPTLGGAPHPAAVAVASRWVPLIPGADGIPGGVSTRSGAFLMAATRIEPGRPATPPRAEPDLNLRSALISCLEAIAPTLEPGWTHCEEHPACRAVQEASVVLWGSPSAPASPNFPDLSGPVVSPRPVADPANLPLPDHEPPVEPREVHELPFGTIQ